MMEYIDSDLMNEFPAPQNLRGRICVIPHDMVFILCIIIYIVIRNLYFDSSRNTRFDTVPTKIILNTKKYSFL